MNITIDYDDAAVRAALDRLIERGQRLAPSFELFGEHLVRSHSARWAAGQAPDGSPWAPLKPSTWAKKKGTKPLYEKGDLLRGLIIQPTDQELAFGLADWKAPIHHFGAEIPARTIAPRGKKALHWPGARHPVAGPIEQPGFTIPARPLVGIGPDDRVELLAILEDALRLDWGK